MGNKMEELIDWLTEYRGKVEEDLNIPMLNASYLGGQRDTIDEVLDRVREAIDSE